VKRIVWYGLIMCVAGKDTEDETAPIVRLIYSLRELQKDKGLFKSAVWIKAG